MKHSKTISSTLALAYIALMAAMITICSWISIPFAVPFTLQTRGIFIAAGMLGARRGTLCVAVYIALGAVGLPVFSGFRGGAGVLLGATGGYILGFLPAAALAGWLISRMGRSIPRMALCMAAGQMLCYALGTVWFMLVYARTSGSIGIMTALSMCVFPFILPDALKIILAAVIVHRTRRAVGRM